MISAPRYIRPGFSSRPETMKMDHDYPELFPIPCKTLKENCCSGPLRCPGNLVVGLNLHLHHVVV